MSGSDSLVFYHWPQSRGATARWALEEANAPYELKLFNLQKGEHKCAELRALNHLCKLPTLVHGDSVITETAAIIAYIADLFPQAGLAPEIGDKTRGPYLRWLVFCVATFEPAMIDRALKREPANAGMVPYGDFDTVLETIADAIARGPYLLGERFSAADIMLGASLRWVTLFGLLPERPDFRAYIDRIVARPGIARSIAKDAEIMKELG